MQLANRGRLLPQTPDSVQLRTCIFSNLDTIFPDLVTDLLSFEHPSVLLLFFIVSVHLLVCVNASDLFKLYIAALEEAQTELIQMYTDITEAVDVLPYEDSAGLPITNIFAPLLMEEDLQAKERMPNRHSLGGKELKSLREIFYTSGKPVKRIFMKGDAGCGKTLFCLKMLDAWCRVKQPKNKIDTEIQAGNRRKLSCLKMFSSCFQEQQSETVPDDVLQHCLAVFDLVFYIPLRHFRENLTSVKDMVAQTVSEQCQNVLMSGRMHCLVILDGLDESPATFRKLPSMHGIVSYTLFCTTRPWKLTQFQLKFRPDDKVVQLKGLLPSSIPKVIEYVLINFYKLKRKTPEFKRKFKRYSSFLESSSLESLVKIPMMLTACCCMWYEEDTHSEQSNERKEHVTIDSLTRHPSMIYTYLSLIDSMIRRADEKCDLKCLLTQEHSSPPTYNQKVLTGFSYFISFLNTLLPLCRLAHTDLVSDNTKLVFQKDELERDLGNILVQVALKIGLISQTKAPGRFHQQNVSVNFYHKSVQEFLAAVHLTCTNTDDIRPYCTSLDKVMDIANVILFGIALDTSFCHAVSKHVLDIVNTDGEMQEYRRTLDYKFSEKVRQLYHTQYQWYRELTHCQTVTGDTSSSLSLNISDIWMDINSDSDEVKLTGDLICHNLQSIVSVALWGVDDSLHRIRKLLPQCPNLSALRINQTVNKEDHDQLVSVIPRLTQLTTIQIEGRFTDNDRAVVKAVMTLTQLTRIILDYFTLGDDGMKVTDMTKLQTVKLTGVRMSAGGWESFVSSLLTLNQSLEIILDSTDIDRETVSRVQNSPRLTMTQDNGKLTFTTLPSPTR